MLDGRETVRLPGSRWPYNLGAVMGNVNFGTGNSPGVSVASAIAAAASASASATAAAASLATTLSIAASAPFPVFDLAAHAISNGVKNYTGLVGGSGGTNGTFALTVSGGGGSGFVGRFVVAGGALTNIFIDAPGNSFTSAPTFSFSASTGLTGASATAVIGANVAVGGYFYTPSLISWAAADMYVVNNGPAASYLKSIPSATQNNALADVQVKALSKVALRPDFRTFMYYRNSYDQEPQGYINDTSLVSAYYSSNRVIKQDGSSHLIAFHGDSITLGVNVGDFYTAKLIRHLLGRSIVCDYKNRGITGQGLNYVYSASSSCPNLISDAASEIDTLLALSPDVRLVLFAGTNDLWLGGVSGATLLGYLNTYLDARIAAGWTASKIYVCTMLPRQLNEHETDRTTFNNGVMADSGTRGYSKVALHLNANIGLVNAQNNTTYFQADKIHPTVAGHEVIRSILEPVMFP